MKAIAAMESEWNFDSSSQRPTHQPCFEYRETFEEYVLDILL